MFSLIKNAEFKQLNEQVKAKRVVSKTIDLIENVNKNHLLYDILLNESDFINEYYEDEEEIEFEPQPEFRGKKPINLARDRQSRDENDSEDEQRRVVVLVKHRGKWIPTVAKKSRYFDKMYLVNPQEDYKKEVMRDQIVSISEIPDKRERDFLEKVIGKLGERKVVVYGVYDPSVSIAKRYGQSL